MKKTRWKKILKWTQIIFLVYIVLGIAIYFLQDRILFHPVKLPEDHQFTFDQPFREEKIVVDEDRMISMVHFTVPDSLRKGIVLYFHGNRTNITRYAPFAKFFTRNGYETWMIDYPGFGKSTGKRTEKILHDDALSFYKMALARVPAEQIVIYGKSMGSGMASKLAAIRDCKMLILETPFYSIDAIARQYFFIYPVNPMTKYTMPNHLHVPLVHAPVTIFHGTRDAVVPYRQGKKLAGVKPGIKLVTIPGGRHNNLTEFPEYGSKIDSLLKN
jgi:alpha-beta hydrolase superfamily lysophospholipase